MSQLNAYSFATPSSLKFGGGIGDDKVYFIVSICIVAFLELMVLVNFFVENKNLQIANDIFLLLFFFACVFFLWDQNFNGGESPNYFYKIWLLTLFVAAIRSPFLNPLLDRKNKWKYYFGGFSILFICGAPSYLKTFFAGGNPSNLFDSSNYPMIALGLLVIILFLSSY
jgi:hypothetical protein